VIACVLLQCLAEKDRAQLVHPRDRNGRSLPERYASGELEDALEAFRSACAAATAAVRERLRQLASQLQAGLSGPSPCCLQAPVVDAPKPA
jgi:hypothetical protein